MQLNGGVHDAVSDSRTSLQNLLYSLHQSAARAVVKAIGLDFVGVCLEAFDVNGRI